MSQYQLPIVDIAQIPIVDLEVMNQVHREEVALINRLGSLLLTGLKETPDIDAISQNLSEWIAHTKDHFEAENRMMEEHGFPPYPVHKGEHEQVLSRLEALQQQWSVSQELESLAQFVFVEWRDWFDTHVKTMDTVTASFLTRFIG